VAAAQPAGDLPEAAASRAAQSGWAIFREHRRAILPFFVIMAVGNIGFYIFQYATTYAQNVLHMPPSVGFASTVSLNTVGIAATLLGGWLADAVGRKPVFLASRIAVAVAAVPVFLWIAADRTPTALIVGVTLLAALSQLGTGANWIWFAELLPRASAAAPTARPTASRSRCSAGLRRWWWPGSSMPPEATSRRPGISPGPICWQPLPP
jgi:MFS family permease